MKLRQGGVKLLVHDPVANRWQSQNLNPGILTLSLHSTLSVQDRMLFRGHFLRDTSPVTACPDPSPSQSSHV